MIGRDFNAEAVDEKWCGDLTEIPTDEGKLYLATVEDLASRRLPGFAIGSHHDAAAESFNSTLEWELLSRRHFATKTQARSEIAGFIDRYNHRGSEAKGTDVLRGTFAIRWQPLYDTVGLWSVPPSN